MVARRHETCYYCQFWVGQGVRERGPKGTCRRYPPTVTPRAPDGSFPVTLLTDWCGEWLRTAGVPLDGANDAAASNGEPGRTPGQG